MISYQKAKKLISNNILNKDTRLIPLNQSLGYVLAKSVYCPHDMPLHDNSAMDGYVFRFRDTKSASVKNPVHLKIDYVIKAGDAPSTLKSGTAAKIMTGAFIPRRGDVVLPREEAVIENNHLVLKDVPKRGKHIRCKGEEIKRGKVAVRKRTVLNSGVIGFLASMGIEYVSVYAKPKISIIVTGSELLNPGEELTQGKIYDSNSLTIHSALKEMGVVPQQSLKITDSNEKIKEVLNHALNDSDIIIVTGGVSVGDYDYVKETLSELGVEKVFWKVNQKPGKPIYFGKKQSKLVFGLPGNPASVFICFHEYVYPAIKQWMGYRYPELESLHIPIAQNIKNTSDKFLFLKCRVAQNGKGKVAGILSHQSSHMLSSLCSTNALALIPPKSSIEKDEVVHVHVLPGVFDGGLI